MGKLPPHTGLQTVQALRTSVAAMQSIVDLAQGLRELKGTHVVIVAHSLGGAVGASWARTTAMRMSICPRLARQRNLARQRCDDGCLL